MTGEVTFASTVGNSASIVGPQRPPLMLLFKRLDPSLLSVRSCSLTLDVRRVISYRGHEHRLQWQWHDVQREHISLTSTTRFTICGWVYRATVQITGTA